MITTVTGRELSANDRCDSCGAAARVVATFLYGELMFCGHHARTQINALTNKALEVYDPEGELRLIN